MEKKHMRHDFQCSFGPQNHEQGRVLSFKNMGYNLTVVGSHG